MCADILPRKLYPVCAAILPRQPRNTCMPVMVTVVAALAPVAIAIATLALATAASGSSARDAGDCVSTLVAAAIIAQTTRAACGALQ
eukprot:gene9308-biopygen965